MSWVKRNLYFLIGGAVAVTLLGLAGFYLYSKWKLNNDAYAKLEAAHADWNRILDLPVGPGNDKINNIELAREQTKNVRAVIQNVRKYFVPIPPIPDMRRMSRDDFATALRVTIAQLQRDATNASVGLLPRFNFSFETQKNIFDIRNPELLAPKLGDVKTICDILFRAKIHSLESLRRERVTPDDIEKGVQSDYLEASVVSVTNDLAVLVPYEVTFTCFSRELAEVLSGFANAPNGFVVRAVNVLPVGGVAATSMPGMPGAPGMGTETPGMGAANPIISETPGTGYRPYQTYPPGTPGVAPTPAPASRSGLTTVRDEQPLRATLMLNVVRLSPPKR